MARRWNIFPAIKQVYVNEERPITVAEALVGINQLIGAVQHRRATRLLWFGGRLRRGRNMPYAQAPPAGTLLAR